MSNMLLHFETRVPQMPNFALFNTPVKIMERVGEISTVTFTTIIYVPEACFRIPVCCSVSKPEHFKGDLGQKSRPILHFLTPVEIRDG